MKKHILLFLSLIVTAQIAVANKDYALYLQSGRIYLPENAKEIALKKSQSFGVINNSYRLYVQFYDNPTTVQKKELETKGMRLISYLPNYTWMSEVSVSFDFSQVANYGIRSVFEPKGYNKLAKRLATKDYTQELVTGNKIKLIAHTLDERNAEQVNRELSQMGVLISRKKGTEYHIVAPIALIETLASKLYFYYIEEEMPKGEPENLRGRTNHRSAFLSENSALGYKYNGSGVDIAMFDDGSIGPHIDYKGRIRAQYASTAATASEHGDHVSGTIMGAGNLNPDTRGMAWGAKISVYNAQLGGSTDYNGFDSIPRHYYNPGIVITSTSYSNGCNAGYTSFARQIDQQLNAFPSLMHVFSAGNSNGSDCGYGAGNQWGNITGGHKVGKNCLTVANANYKDQIDATSSRGPAHDGRIKPEITGVGVDVNSTQPNNTYDIYSGTSMSCPGLSGTLGQLYQAFKEHNGGQNPAGGLVKAIVMNTADDIGVVGPDFIFGYGRVNALRALKVIQDTTFFEDSITDGNSNLHTIDVPANVKMLKVMVYWSDVEATASASVALVNNINMQLSDPSSNTYNPWVLDHRPNASTLALPATRAIDSLNNAEQVTLDNPAAGTYNLTVEGHNIPVGPQKYYVVYSYVMDDITVVYPVAGEGFVPNGKEIIRWDAYGNTGTFTVEYSTNLGSTWTVISSTVGGGLRSYDWTVPTVVTGKALVRVSRGAVSDISDAPFNIIRVPGSILVSEVCEDSMKVSWVATSGATSYDVFLLGNEYMDSVGTTVNTFFRIKNITGVNEHWVSVRARGADNAVGKRANAVKKAAGILSCIYPNDAGTTAIKNTDGGTVNSCLDMNSMNVVATIKNTGSNSISNIPVNLKLDNGSVITETYTGTIAAGATYDYMFTTPIDASSAGNHTISVWTSYPGDGHTSDDSTVTTINVLSATSSSFPWSEPFDSYTNCSTTGCNTVCTIPGNWINEVNQTFDDIDWRLNSGNTPSSSTGPSADHTTGSGKYVYLEATTCNSLEAVLTSPCVDVTGVTQPISLSFWYHMYGSAMGTLAVDVFDGQKWVKNVSTISGNQNNVWLNKTINLTNQNLVNGNVLAVKFRGITGTAGTSDLALDDIMIDIITSVKMREEELSRNFTVYPNPATSTLNIELVNNRQLNAKIRITDIQGKECVKNEVVFGSTAAATLDVSNLKAGMYFIEIETEENKYTGKISVER